MSKHLDAAETIITDCLDGSYTPPVTDPSWEHKLQSLRDFSALAWYTVGRNTHFTAADASDAIDDYIIMLESGEPMRYLGEPDAG